MRALSSSDFLDLWERGRHLHPIDQGLLVLSAALPEMPCETFADWTLGRRNRALAELRCDVFGPGLRGWLSCPNCGEKLEFELDGRALAGEERNSGEESSKPIEINGQTFRLPRVRDLARLSTESDSRLAAIRLLEACRVEAGEASSWSDEDLEEIGQKMALADPATETQISLRCAVCDSVWEETLEIGTFLWAEIEARAKRILLEIHTLALGYGWTEKEILSLGESRRGLYVEMLRS